MCNATSPTLSQIIAPIELQQEPLLPAVQEVETELSECQSGAAPQANCGTFSPLAELVQQLTQRA